MNRRPSASRDDARVAEVHRLLLGGTTSVGPLVALLADASWVVRRAVIAALGRIGLPAIGALCDVLASNRNNETMLAAAVDALVASAGPVESAVLALADAHPAPAVLCDVAQILGRRKSRECVATLAAWTTHADDNVAVASIEALGRIGGPAALAPLVAALGSGNFFRTFPAIASLEHVRDPSVVEALTPLLSQPYYVNEAAATLGRLGYLGGVAPLAGLLVHESDAVVSSAANALVDLRREHLVRFGQADAALEAFRAAAPAGAAERVADVIAGASATARVPLACILGWLDNARGAATLIELLDGEATTAQVALESLRSMPPETQEALRRAVATGSSAVRARVLPLLAGRRDAVPQLIACLADDDPDVRALACEALGAAGDPAAVRPLFELVGDADTRVAHAAVAAIQSLGSDEARTQALAAARSPDPRVRRAALRVLSYFAYPESLDALLEGAADPDERMRDAAMTGLALLESPKALEALLAALRHANPTTRAAACRALSNATASPEVNAALIRALDDEEPWVRYYACQSLGRLHVSEATARIATHLDDPAGQVRVAAVGAVAQLGGQRAFALLTSAATVNDPDVRRAALIGLAAIRRPEAMPILVAAAFERDPGSRLVALSAIAEIATPDADAALIRAASDPDDVVRSAAIALLGPRGESATRWLLGRVGRSEDHDAVVSALCHAAPSRVEAVLQALSTADATTADTLVETLLCMRHPNGNAAVEAALHFDNVDARRAAAAALCEMGTPSARAALAIAARADEDARVRAIAKRGV